MKHKIMAICAILGLVAVAAFVVSDRIAPSSSPSGTASIPSLEATLERSVIAPVKVRSGSRVSAKHRKELELFWMWHLDILVRTITRGGLPFEAASRRILDSRAIIRDITGRDIVVTPLAEAFEGDLSVTCRAFPERHEIAIFLPALKAMHDRLEATDSPTWRAEFANHMVAVIMRETEKIRVGLSDPHRDGIVPEAYGFVAEHALVPMTRMGKPEVSTLPEAERKLAEAWVSVGRDSSSPTWRQYVKNSGWR